MQTTCLMNIMKFEILLEFRTVIKTTPQLIVLFNSIGAINTADKGT